MPTGPHVRYILWVLVLGATPILFAEQPEYIVRATDTPIVIDGRLDEASWRDATVIPLDFEYQPGDNIPAVVSTDAMITFDHKFLYVAFRAEDPEPDKIRAHLMDRDQINTFVQDDHVVLLIDTFNDERRGFQFRVNPLGVQADAIFSEIDGYEDFSWDKIWDSAGRITEFGYVVEIAISLKQLRFPRTQEAQTWGFDLSRSYPRNVRHRFSAVPKDRDSSCNLCQVAKVTGFTGLEPGRNLDINPTFTAIRTDAAEVAEPHDLKAGDPEYEVGITGAWGVTPNITLSGTINPDFSHIEADVAQLEVNERFALFYPETRPFFLVGIDLFVTPIQAVFTRTVVDPKWGLKVTGKEGRHNFGLFVTSDELNQLLVPSNQGSRYASLDGPTDSAVLRYRYDVGSASALGMLVTNREGIDYHNRVGGIDGFFRFSPSNILRFQALRSDTSYPIGMAEAYGQPEESFSGNAVEATFQHNSRNWFVQVDYEDYEPGFRADLGFIPRVDTRTLSGFAQRTIWGDTETWYTDINFGGVALRTEDHGGELTDELYQLYGNVGGPWQSRIAFNVNRIAERYDGVFYDGLIRYRGNVVAQPSGSVRFALGLVYGDTIDYANNQLGETLEANPNLELKFGKRVNAWIGHNMRRIDVKGGQLFQADLTQFRLVYHFNVRTLVRGTFQYYNIERDPSLYTGPWLPATEERTLYSEFLFSYKLNPQTVVFVGVSENRLGLPGMSLTETDRTYFIKLGYAWLF